MTTSPVPTLWFSAPTAPTGSPNPAGQQFMDLFTNPAAWQVTLGQSAGFVLSETFILQATDTQLTQVFDFLKLHNLKMMMVTAMVPVQTNGVGNGLEGFTTTGQLSQALHRITSLGGTLDNLGMDAPLSAGHEFVNGPQLSITALAQQIAPNVAMVKAAFPNVVFSDGQGFVSTSDLGQWAQAFQQATGSPIAEFDADVNWNLPNWQSQLETYAAAARAAGVTFGIAGNATSLQQTNLNWTLAAEANIAAAEADPLIRPTDIGVQSWNANPTVILPEGLSGTLSHVAVEVSQFAPLYASGYLTGGLGVMVNTIAPAPSYVGSAADAVAGAAVAVPGVKIVPVSSPGSAGMTYAVVITDVAGTLGATASGTGKVSGAGTNVMTLTGVLADINAELASLVYTGSAAGTDTIDITTYDGIGLVDDHQFAVAIAAPISVPLPAGVGVAALYQNIFGYAPKSATLAAAQAALTAGQTLAHVAAPWIAQGQATITALFEQVQGVSPTAGVLTSLTAALMGGQSVAQIRTSLAGAASVQSELKTFYTSHYGAAPTAPQLAALTQQLASGTSLQAIEAPLLANSQAEAQITTLYQQIEGQAPNASDLATGARALLTGTPLAMIRTQLATSALVQNNLSTLYQHVYDQTPTAAQLASVTAQLNGTTTYAQIQTQFTQQAQAAVTAIFQSVLNRNPTANELATNTGNLVAGAISRGVIWASLAFSAVSGANVTAVYEQVIGQAPPQTMVTELEEVLAVGPNPTPLVQLGADLQAAATLYTQITGQAVTADALTPLMFDFLNHAPISEIRTWVGFSGQENQIIQNSYQQLFGNAITADVLNTLKLALVAGTTTMASVQAAFKAQAAADVPVISNVVASQDALANSFVFPLGAITVADSDPGAIETATVSLNGSGRLITGTTVVAAPNIYTIKGTASNVTAYLRGLNFAPPTGAATTWLSLTVQNGAGNTTTTKLAINTETMRSPVQTAFLYAPAQNVSLALYPAETVVFGATGFGTDTLTGFSITQGVIELPRTIAASFATVQAHEAATAGGTLISFSPSESILISGIAPSSLHASNFNIV